MPAGPVTLFRSRIVRESLKFAISFFQNWTPLEHPVEGYSIVTGVPWRLRHLVDIYLKFVTLQNRKNLRAIHLVVDRPPQSGVEQWQQTLSDHYPELPVQLRFCGKAAGRLVAMANVPPFYHALTTTTGLSDCLTQHAILHDFDLYPLEPEYFETIYQKMKESRCRFAGTDHTFYCGLNEQDNILGTWALGLDVSWLRSHCRPVDCFHKVVRTGDRLISFDPYTYIQWRTPDRRLIENLSGNAYCHVDHLCSTHTQMMARKPFKPVWRLHFLWYLEYLSGAGRSLDAITACMEQAGSGVLRVDHCEIDFSGTDPTCANVLESNLIAMEKALAGGVRPEVSRYINAFRQYLLKLPDC